MAFSVVEKVKALAADSKSTSAAKLLERYADFDVDAQKQQGKGERGIVVLSLDGDEPIFAPVEEYFTGALDGKTKRADGLAGTVSQYLAEHRALACLTADAGTVSFDVLFDAESPQ